MLCGSVYFASFIHFVLSGTFPIEWNASSDTARDHHVDDYPQFTNVAPRPCDLTANVCDVGCCLDADCDPEQIQAFNCLRVTLDRCATRPTAAFDCNCVFPDKPFWFSALCYVFENPIYLGLFYKARDAIASADTFRRETETRRKFKYDVVSLPVRVKKSGYAFREPILSYVSRNGSYVSYPHPLLRPSVSGAHCHPQARFFQNVHRDCLVRLTEEKCEEGIALGALSYLLRNDTGDSTPEIPVVLANPDETRIVPVKIALKCSPSDHVVKKIRGKTYKLFYPRGQKVDCSDSHLSETVWNGTHCSNLLAGVDFHFISNATELVSISVELLLMNAFLDFAGCNEDGFQKELVYLKRKYSISFSDISRENNSNATDRYDNYVYNRGYHVGELLNFGYNRTNGSAASVWERGRLSMFINGDSGCRRTAQVTFGYDSSSSCRYQGSGDCARTSREIKELFDSLVDGDHLAPYARFWDSRRRAVPVLRNYNDSSSDDDGNSTKCRVATEQVVVIQFVRVASVRRAIGLLVERRFRPVESPLHSLLLTSEVVFVDATADRASKRIMSRFWQKVYSRERSENAWTNVAKIFEDTTEESTFWFVALVVALLATYALFRSDVGV